MCVCICLARYDFLAINFSAVRGIFDVTIDIGKGRAWPLYIHPRGSDMKHIEAKSYSKEGSCS